MPWVSRTEWEEPERTLGWLIADWAEAFLRVPGGADYGKPMVLSGWQLRCLADWYAVGPDGRWLFRRGQVRMAKGTGKSPFAAVVAIAELCGPVVFDGLDAHGDPVGRPRNAPLVQIAAVSEDQAGNTYGALHAMLAESPLLEEAGIDLGVTRTVLRGRPGRIETVSASAGSREGQPITGCLADEALALDTPIPTPTGWTTMADVRAGDLLLGSNGLPCRVVKATDVMDDRDCYRVHFADGTSVVASAGHLWRAKVDGRVKVRTTEQMAAGRRALVPLPAATKLPEADLPLDPYVLGAWLGDGYTGQAYVCGHQDDLSEMAEYFRAAGVWVSELSRLRTDSTTCRVSLRRDPALCPSGHAGPWRVSLNASGGPHRHCVSCHAQGRAETLTLSPREILKGLGVLRDKHIPASYLRGSIDQRVALLQGLMDTDGSVGPNGSCVFVNTNPALVNGVVELLRSLGIRASARWRSDERSASYKPIGKVHFVARNGVMPFRLRRKVERVRPSGRDWLAITSIERVPSTPVRCVAVDADDHLFLAGEGWTVTHNTHLWTRSNSGRRLYATLLRNASKMGARLLATTNAWVPGDESVAEQAELAAERAPGILVYGPQFASEVDDVTDPEQLRAGLAVTYRDAPWVDQDRILADCLDPDMSVEDVHRFHLNRPVAADAVLCSTPTLSPDVLEPGSPIALGFDGSRTRDATALVAVHMLTGVAHLLGYWERPPGLPVKQLWEVPRGEVTAVVDQAFRLFHVARFKADPSHWQDELAGWKQAYTPAVVDRFPVWQSSVVDQSVEATQTALAAGALRLSDAAESAVMVAHTQRAQVARRQVGARTLRSLSKPEDSSRIDCAAALTYAWQARMEATARGWQDAAAPADPPPAPFAVFA